MDAPPGSGKSRLLICLMRLLARAFYVTPQLSLIQQLVEDPVIGEFVKEIKGRQNYLCGLTPNVTADMGLCELKHFPCDEKNQICPYIIAKNLAKAADIALMSFAYHLLDSRMLENGFEKRKTLGIDEAHNIAEAVVNYSTLTLSNWTLPKEIYKRYEELIKSVSDLEEAKELIVDVYKECQKQLSILKSRPVLTKEQTDEYKKITKLMTDAKTFYDTLDKTVWTFQVDKETSQIARKPNYKVTFAPLFARFFTGVLWKKADFIILSSGTFGDIDIFIKETGLDLAFKREEIFHIEMPSTFPAKNRPIIDRSCGRMTFGEQEETLPKAVRMLERIIEEEKGNNVVVHCHSYKLQQTILKMIRKDFLPLIMHHDSHNKQGILDEWKSSRGKVLLAVGMTEGQDFKDDICRAQVLFKVPFPNVGDKRVAIRLNEMKQWDWYYNQTLITIIQAYGRAVRSPTDWARFYFIDSCFWDVIRRCWRAVPRYVKEALPPMPPKSPRPPRRR